MEHTRQHLYRGPGTGATVVGTTGARLVEGLGAEEGEPVVVKKRFSGFFQTHLDMLLRRCAFFSKQGDVIRRHASLVTCLTYSNFTLEDEHCSSVRSLSSQLPNDSVPDSCSCCSCRQLMSPTCYQRILTCATSPGWAVSLHAQARLNLHTLCGRCLPCRSPASHADEYAPMLQQEDSAHHSLWRTNAKLHSSDSL